jgi:hypothetical protein
LHLGDWLFALLCERGGCDEFSIRLLFAEGRMDGGGGSRIQASITSSTFVFFALFFCPPAQLAIQTLVLLRGLLLLSSLVTLHENTQLGRIEVVGQIGDLPSILPST